MCRVEGELYLNSERELQLNVKGTAKPRPTAAAAAATAANQMCPALMPVVQDLVVGQGGLPRGKDGACGQRASSLSRASSMCSTLSMCVKLSTDTVSPSLKT